MWSHRCILLLNRMSACCPALHTCTAARFPFLSLALFTPALQLSPGPSNTPCQNAANVFRDGKRVTLDADKLVPGDIVAIKSGDRLPADMRLLQVSNLQVRRKHSLATPRQANACAMS